MPLIIFNSNVQISTEFDPDHLRDLGYISAKMRETLGAARRPEFIAGYISVAGHLMMLAADKEEHFFFGSDHNTLSMNSNAVYVLPFSRGHSFLVTPLQARLASSQLWISFCSIFHFWNYTVLSKGVSCQPYFGFW